MASVGFLGCGEIGKAIVRHIQAHKDHSIAFVQDPFFENDCGLDCPVVPQLDRSLCRADLVVECATAVALIQNYEHYLAQGDMLIFSVTAFSDETFAAKAVALCKAHNTHIYFPHGAILGLGFDKTQSRIISDPAVHTNSHDIYVAGDGVSFRLEISSFASGGVTGRYTPISACGSMDRILGGDAPYRFV